MLFPAMIEVAAGIGAVWLAVLSWQGRLPRSFFAGVRTRSTMRSDEAFKAANKAAAPLTGLGGAVLAAGGVAVAALPKASAGVPLLGSAVIFAVLCLAGGVRGVRASR